MRSRRDFVLSVFLCALTIKIIKLTININLFIEYIKKIRYNIVRNYHFGI